AFHARDHPDGPPDGRRSVRPARRGRGQGAGAAVPRRRLGSPSSTGFCAPPHGRVYSRGMKIRRLSEGTVNRIAAGEVVERPASAVKELVENALDAGAKRIEISVSAGGADLILVEDDGDGMEADDLSLAVERHATSKLRDDDLSSIATMGFRGEALPSIGAVARLSIASRTKTGEAHEIRVDGGAITGPSPVAFRAKGQSGTRVDVRELFY